MYKKTISALALFVTISFQGFSQTKQDAIKELFSLMKTDSLIDKTFNAIVPAITQQMKAKDPKVDQKKLDDVFKASMDAAKEMSKSMINTDLVVLYDKYFTEQEIKDFTAFYRTPAGQKMITVLPDLQKEMMTIMMTKYMPEMQNKIMKAVGPPPNSAPAAKQPVPTSQPGSAKKPAPKKN